jgi:hypothetical protein
MPLRRILLIASGILVAGIAFLVFLFLYTGSVKPIESIADQLQPGNDWQVISTQTEPPRIICLGDNPCPSVHRTWKTSAILSRPEFEQLLTASGWQDFAIEGDCAPKTNSFSAATVCSASGTRDQFNVEIHVIGSNNDTDDGKISLFIRPT